MIDNDIIISDVISVIRPACFYTGINVRVCVYVYVSVRLSLKQLKIILLPFLTSSVSISTRGEPPSSPSDIKSLSLLLPSFASKELYMKKISK